MTDELDPMHGELPGLPPAPETPASPYRKPRGDTEAERVQDQVARQAGIGAGQAAALTGHLMTDPVLVVNQKAKLIELTAEFKVFDVNGNQIGSVAQVGQSTLKKAVRLVSSLDQYMTHTYEIRDASDAPIMRLVRPRKFIKSKFAISAADGTPIGEVIQKNMMGKIRFGLMVGGQEQGTLNAENWRAWNFNILDASGQEIGRITKTFEGIAKTLFTSADNYVVQLNPALTGPLRALVVASALCVDTALKQDQRGFN